MKQCPKCKQKVERCGVPQITVVCTIEVYYWVCTGCEFVFVDRKEISSIGKRMLKIFDELIIPYNEKQWNRKLIKRKPASK